MTNLMHKFLKYIYYNPLHVHVSSNILLVIGTSNCINTASGVVTLNDSPVHRLRKKFVMQNKQNRYINTRTSKQNCVPRKNNAVIWYNKTCRTKQLSSLSTRAPDGHLMRVTMPDAVLIQFDLLRMSKILLETCRGL
jgi:hypothetical protein